MTDVGRAGTGAAAGAAGAGAAAAAAVPGRDGGGYVVRRGDSLWGIARQHGVSLAELEAANPELASHDFILPGDRVTIPHAGPHAGGGAREHMMRAGETVSGIACHNGVSARQLARANYLSHPDLIHPGDRLVIPRAASAPARTAAAWAPAPAGGVRALFDPALGSRAPGAVVIGQAEGTRRPTAASGRRTTATPTPGTASLTAAPSRSSTPAPSRPRRRTGASSPGCRRASPPSRRRRARPGWTRTTPGSRPPTSTSTTSRRARPAAS